MKRAVWMVGMIIVISISVFLAVAVMPSLTSGHDAADAVAMVQPAGGRAVGAMPIWGWLVFVTALCILLLLGAAPLAHAGPINTERVEC